MSFKCKNPKAFIVTIAILISMLFLIFNQTLIYPTIQTINFKKCEYVNDSSKLKRHFEFDLPVWKHKTTCDRSSLTTKIVKEALQKNVIDVKDHKQGYPENRKECSSCHMKV